MKPASRAWNKKFEQFNGFTKGNADSCACLQKDSDDFTIMVIWLDDGVLCSTRQFRLYDIVIYLSDKFEITSGPLYHFVGFEIALDRQKKMIYISQQSYQQFDWSKILSFIMETSTLTSSFITYEICRHRMISTSSMCQPKIIWLML